jgi:hypothetical protein
MVPLGWAVEAEGLFGARPVSRRGGARHRPDGGAPLGHGSGQGGAGARRQPGVDDSRCAGPSARRRATSTPAPSVLWTVNRVADVAEQHGGWLHVDGACGPWAAASPTLAEQIVGAARAVPVYAVLSKADASPELTREVLPTYRRFGERIAAAGYDALNDVVLGKAFNGA